MFRRYGTSKLRLGLLLVAAGMILFFANTGLAQSAGAGAAATRKQDGVFSLIAANMDFVFVTIVLLSIVGVTLIIQGFIQCRRANFMPVETINTIRELIAQKRFKELIDFTEADPSFISRAINPALKRAPSFAAMKEAMETSLGEQTAEQFRRIEYLNIIGNLGPLLGLLGTVLGMIDAFQALHAAEGQANPADLAYGISKALTHTMLGLLLAVPCLAAFGVLRTMVDRLTVQGAMEAEELLLMIKPVEARPGMPGALAPAVRAGAAPQPAVPVPPPPSIVRKAPLPAPSPMPSPQE